MTENTRSGLDVVECQYCPLTGPVGVDYVPKLPVLSKKLLPELLSEGSAQVKDFGKHAPPFEFHCVLLHELDALHQFRQDVMVLPER
jgi:hypothetical protein